MKKLLALMILLAGFVVCHAKAPPGGTVIENSGLYALQFNVVQDCSMLFNVVAYDESQVLYDQGSAFIVERRVDTPYEFSNCLTAILPAIYMDSGLKPEIERWIPLAAGGVGYAESTGQVNLTQQIWLTNECIRQC